MVTLAVTVVYCLFNLNAVLGVEENESPSCIFNIKDIKQCYNPTWCSGVLSARECSDRSQCCKHLHRKVECLTDMFDEQLKSCEGLNESLTTLDSLSKNLSKVESRVGQFRFELDTLSRTCLENERTMADLEAQKEVTSTINSKIYFIDDKLKRYEADLHSMRTEVSWLKQSKSNIEDQLITLTREIDLLKEKSSNLMSENETQTTQSAETMSELEALELKSNDLQTNLTFINTEIQSVKKNNSDAYNRLEGLKDKTEKFTDSLSSLEQSIKNERAERERRLSEINDKVTRIISSSESKMQEDCKKEFEKTEAKLNTLDTKLTESESNLTTSFTELNNSFGQYKTEATGDLEKYSNELKGRMERISTRVQTLDDNANTIKATLESEIEKKTTEVLEQSVETINEISDQLNETINKLSLNMNNKTEEINTEMETLSKTLKNSEDNLNKQIKLETEKLITDIGQKTTELTIGLNVMSTKTEAEFKTTNKTLSKIEQDIETYKTENDQNIRDMEQNLTDLIDKMVAEVQSKLNESIKGVKSDIAILRTEIGSRIKSEVEQLSSQTEAVNQTLTQQKERVDIIYPNTFNKEMFLIAFMVLVVLLGINYIIVYSLVKRTSRPTVLTTDRIIPGTQMNEPHSPVEVYNRISFPKSLPHDLSVPLKESVGVVSFYEDSQKHHKRLMNTVIGSIPERLLPDLDIEYHVVRRHEHIPGIPRATLCIMFVEFSERHVIIEEPGLGLGDLKRKTAEHINRLGACLVIVYVKDPGSRKLKNAELFNSSIHCVKSQPELITLAKSGRFLSIYDKFTTNQIERVVDIVTANLGHTGSRHA